MSRYPLDRSAAFTCLLELSPDGFGKTSEPATGEIITGLLEDFYASGQTRMYEYTRQWLSEPEELADRFPALATGTAPEAGPGLDREAAAEDLGAPDERQVMNWAEHDAHAYQPEAG